MKIPKKKYTKIEYIKLILAKKNKRMCDTCKHFYMNYKEGVSLEPLIMKHYLELCSKCKYNSKNSRISSEQLKATYYWIIDNYTSLYDFEDEGE